MFVAESASEIFLIGEYMAKLQVRAWLSHAICMPGQHTAKRRRKCTRQSRNHVLACNFANIYRYKNVSLTNSAINLS